MKQCNKCLEFKETAQFFNHKSTKDRLYPSCKECDKTRRATHYKDNIKKEKETKTLWRKSNKDSHNENGRRWAENNREKRRHVVMKSQRKYPDKKRERDARRRYTKNRATLDSPVYKSQLYIIYKNCPKGYHVDHIVPINGKEVCGLHVPWNLQYLPAVENIRKSNKLLTTITETSTTPTVSSDTNNDAVNGNISILTRATK